MADDSPLEEIGEIDPFAVAPPSEDERSPQKDWAARMLKEYSKTPPEPPKELIPAPSLPETQGVEGGGIPSSIQERLDDLVSQGYDNLISQMLGGMFNTSFFATMTAFRLHRRAKNIVEKTTGQDQGQEGPLGAMSVLKNAFEGEQPEPADIPLGDQPGDAPPIVPPQERVLPAPPVIGESGLPVAPLRPSPVVQQTSQQSILNRFISTVAPQVQVPEGGTAPTQSSGAQPGHFFPPQGTPQSQDQTSFPQPSAAIQPPPVEQSQSVLSRIINQFFPDQQTMPAGDPGVSPPIGGPGAAPRTLPAGGSGGGAPPKSPTTGGAPGPGAPGGASAATAGAPIASTINTLGTIGIAGIALKVGHEFTKMVTQAADAFFEKVNDAADTLFNNESKAASTQLLTSPVRGAHASVSKAIDPLGFNPVIGLTRSINEGLYNLVDTIDAGMRGRGDQLQGFSPAVTAAQAEVSVADVTDRFRQAEQIGDVIAGNVSARAELMFELRQLGDNIIQTVGPLINNILEGVGEVVRILNIAAENPIEAGKEVTSAIAKLQNDIILTAASHLPFVGDWAQETLHELREIRDNAEVGRFDRGKKITEELMNSLLNLNSLGDPNQIAGITPINPPINP